MYHFKHCVMNFKNEKVNHAFERFAFYNDFVHVYHAEHKLK